MHAAAGEELRESRLPWRADVAGRATGGQICKGAVYSSELTVEGGVALKPGIFPRVRPGIVHVGPARTASR